MGKLIFILGGARSGKSAYAQQLAKRAERERGGGVVCIVTAEAGDEEIGARIERHRRDRPPDWETVEAPKKVAAAVAEVGAGRAAVIVDCLTLLMSNLLLAKGEVTHPDALTRLDRSSEQVHSWRVSASPLAAVEENSLCPQTSERMRQDGDAEEATRRVLREVEELIAAARAAEADVIVISNEVGMGVVPPTRLGCLFRDIAGQAHQILTRASDEVYVMWAGLPQKIK